MRFADFKCPKCGMVQEYVPLDKHIIPYCAAGHDKVKMRRIFNYGKHKIVDYSPQYDGGSDKRDNEANEQIIKSRRK